jgi:hypothetical protein
MQLDHVFVCCDVGDPEAEGLRQIGLVEGTRNVHPGQGTENRRPKTAALGYWKLANMRPRSTQIERRYLVRQSARRHTRSRQTPDKGIRNDHSTESHNRRGP